MAPSCSCLVVVCEAGGREQPRPSGRGALVDCNGFSERIYNDLQAKRDGTHAVAWHVMVMVKIHCDMLGVPGRGRRGQMNVQQARRQAFADLEKDVGDGELIYSTSAKVLLSLVGRTVGKGCHAW